MIERPRRLRQTPVLRSLVAETRLHPRDLVLPVFVGEGLTEPRPITSMPGVDQHTLECVDEFTDHGHCGVLDEHGRVDNDATNILYAEMAVAQARAGAHVVAPSGMIDGQVAVIREALDAEGLTDTVILAYSAKYSSAFFGPFREAVQSSLQGDRRTYQQDPANIVESLREIDLDIAEGADMVMVKPAMSYLDVVAAAAERSSVPVAAYQVSGEYSMIHAAAANGWIDLRAAAIESLTSIRRAGAQVVLTYFALDVTEWTA